MFFRNSYFNIDQTSGKINLNKAVDRETMGSSGIIELTVVAEDGGTPPRNSTALIKITINDINDNVPEFCNDGQTLEFTFNELDTKKDFYAAKVGSKIFFRIHPSGNNHYIYLLMLVECFMTDL